MQIIWAKLGIFQTLTISSLPTSFSLPLNSSLESGVGASGTHRNFRSWVPLGTGYWANFASCVPLGTGNRANFKSWVPMGPGYRENFHLRRPLGQTSFNFKFENLKIQSNNPNDTHSFLFHLFCRKPLNSFPSIVL